VRLKNLLFFVCFLISASLSADTVSSFGQSADSVDQSDEIVSQEDDQEQEEDSHALPDTSAITSRTADPEALQKLKSDPELQYKEPPTIAESLWDRFLLWKGQIIGKIFESAVTMNWGKLLAYITGIVLMVVLIMMLLRVNAFKVFYSGAGSGTFRYNALDENIHEMDFEKLIDQAVAKKDYRGGVRLLFLYALKMLSDKNHIHWDQGKTNHDYIDELKLAELKPGFSDLNYYFEYAWYGNFKVNAETFDHVRDIFRTWKTNIK
jgi:hypothetical protein